MSYLTWAHTLQWLYRSPCVLCHYSFYVSSYFSAFLAFPWTFLLGSWWSKVFPRSCVRGRRSGQKCAHIAVCTQNQKTECWDIYCQFPQNLYYESEIWVSIHSMAAVIAAHLGDRQAIMLRGVWTMLTIWCSRHGSLQVRMPPENFGQDCRLIGLKEEQLTINKLAAVFQTMCCSVGDVMQVLFCQDALKEDPEVTWMVEFYAPWCPPCVRFASRFAELSLK